MPSKLIMGEKTQGQSGSDDQDLMQHKIIHR